MFEYYNKDRHNHQRSKIKYKMPVQAHWWDTAMTLLQRNEILNFSVGMANIYIPFNCVWKHLVSLQM